MRSWAVCAFRLALVLLLFWGQLAGGVRAAEQDEHADQLRAVDAAMVLCQPGHLAGQKRAPAPHRILVELAILQAETGAHTAILADAPCMPPPRAPIAMRRANVPPARAPPAVFAPAAYPRGPPALA